MAGSAGASHAYAQDGFLYVASCNDIVKFSVATGAQVADLALWSRTPLVPRVSPREAFCAVEAMTYDAAAHPATVRVNDRNHRVYRALTFSVPQFRLLQARVLPKRWHEDGTEAITDTAAPVRLPGMQTAGTGAGWLTLAGYTGTVPAACTVYGQGQQLNSTPLLQRGDTALLQVDCTGGRRLAAVHAHSHRIALLDVPADHVALVSAAGDRPGDALHLSGDGACLVAFSQGGTPPAPAALHGDQAWLVDLSSGTADAHWQGDRLRDAVFLAFAPGGRLMFQGGERQPNFEEATQVRCSATPPPNGFFANH